jgi:hypothetical protein
MNSFVLIVALLLLETHGGPLGEAIRLSAEPKSYCSRPMQRIGKRAAISIAKREALKTGNLPKESKAVTCELALFWRVIFDGGGPEYVIDKANGLVRRVYFIPEDWSGQQKLGAPNSINNVSADRAIEIAKATLQADLPNEDVNRYQYYVCELQKVWRVFVEFRIYVDPITHRRVIPNSNPPNFVIVKSTGAIFAKNL